MFFDTLEAIPSLAKKTNFSIFALPSEKDFLAVHKLLETSYKSACLFLVPDKKTNKISVEATREFMNLSDTRATSDRFFCVISAEVMTPAAANAFLKNLEEPQSLDHYIFLVHTPSALLSTILSRAELFVLKTKNSLAKPLEADEKVKTLAKQLIVADVKTLISLSNDISKKKDNARAYALEITATAIEILYKTYFATGEEKFLKRLPNLLNLYENLSKNGHIKLHLVADMI